LLLVQDEGKIEAIYQEEAYLEKKEHDESFRQHKLQEEEAMRKKKAL
jgi:hypothetical protein